MYKLERDSRCWFFRPYVFLQFARVWCSFTSRVSCSGLLSQPPPPDTRFSCCSVKPFDCFFVMDPSRYESTCSHLPVITLKCPDDTRNSIAVQICLNPLPIQWLTTSSTTALFYSRLPLSLSLSYSLLLLFPPPLLQHLVVILIFSVVWTTTEANIVMFTLGL